MRFSPTDTPISVAFAVCCVGVGLFSVMDAMMKGLSIAIGVYNALLWRGIAGAALGGAAMLVLRAPLPGAVVMRLHVTRGIVVAFMALTFFWALVRLPMAEAIALSFIAPLIALYLAALLLGERIGRAAIAASLLGIAGVGVILAGRLSGHYRPDALWGAASVLVSAVLFAWNLILQRRQAQLAGPVEIAFYQNLVVLVVLACAAPWLAKIPSVGEAPLIFGSAALAFVSLLCFSWGYARAEAQALIPVEYTAFLWSALLGWLIFAEPLTLATLAGAALIVAGCFIAARGKPGLPHTEAAIA